GLRYEKRLREGIDTIRSGAVPLPINDHSWLPALPVMESDTVIVGTVVSRDAYLSKHKSQVYTEATVAVEQTLKAAEPSTVQREIAVDRWGGAVKMPDGRVKDFETVHKRLPNEGGRYLFFLSYDSNAKAFELVASYELRNGRVHPLDTFPQFTGYADWDERAFLQSVSDTIAKEKGGDR
ncbi:MAG: hypothetical protein ACREDR_33000, partial [Blastocatellia bacterium]